jgi:hypothetical protein
MGIFLVVDPNATAVRDIYRSVFDASMIRHKDIKGTNSDDAHPQYVLKSSLEDAVVGQLEAVKDAMGIGTSHFLMTASQRNTMIETARHEKKMGNVHQLKAADINALSNLEGVITKQHLANITADDIKDGAGNLFLKPEEVEAINSVSNAMDTHLASNMHWTDEHESTLYGGKDIDVHFHASDRDLKNAIGILPWAQVEQDTFIAQCNFSDVLAEKIKSLQQSSHSEGHALESHTDVSITGVQLQNLHDIHYATKVEDAHNVPFGGYDGQYGKLRKVARSDHYHDEYMTTIRIASAPNDSDIIGTIKVHEGFLYAKTASGWMKGKLEAC